MIQIQNQSISFLYEMQVSDILPTASVVPNTDEKLLSETNALVCVAGAESAEHVQLSVSAQKSKMKIAIAKCALPTNGWAGGGAPNISANGFPNCSKSSDAFAFGGWAEAAVGPNKSTIFAALVGDDKNGLFAAADAPPVGDVSFVCCCIQNEIVKYLHMQYETLIG